MPAKNIVFTSASRATLDDPTATELVKLKRERSPQLHNLIGFFQRQEKQIFSVQVLARRGVTAIALPNVESLLSDEGHFRPHATFRPKIKVGAWDIRDPNSEEAASHSYMGILGILEGKIQHRLFSKNPPRFRTFASERGPWASLGTPSPFFGVMDGLYGRGVEGEEYSYIQTLKEWEGPESEKATYIPPPHVKMSVSHNCDAPENAFLGSEMRAILSVLYNRVYQPGYENESVFPILYISGYRFRLVRVIEAVFDLPQQKLTLKFTPNYSFLKRKDAPWDLFFGVSECSPRTPEEPLKKPPTVSSKTEEKKTIA
ncbi:hypothetical protein N7537_004541 [Penicillium hordei]|uniref:Uncharacterized protein n=1 Tax=Penicillium hordei TaxID=40994 RepID=A0AAD6EBL1_9EURO|nr:uncharacterized protein N7537_004541 [Penicillium hordei]KAJ5607922.1 hypothetical protein N7537_004541 [Penicillium hordei]